MTESITPNGTSQPTFSEALKSTGAAPGANSEITTSTAAPQIQNIPTGELEAGSCQPRTLFNTEAIEHLAQSIETYGVLQPLIVRKGPKGNFEIIAGERRWRAAKLANLKSVPCIVRPPDAQDTLEVALIENIQRQDLTPIEEARALAELISVHGYTHEALSKRLGLSRANVTNTLRILQLSDNIKEYIHSGKLSEGHAKAILTLESPSQRELLAKLAVEKDLSVRRTEELARELKSEQEASPTAKPRLLPNLRHLCDQFKGHLGTKVKITGDLERGRIEISYYSQEDLDRISELVLGPDPL